MKIKIELLKNSISELLCERLADLEIDADKIADTVDLSALSEIKEIISDDKNSDFDAVEKIVCVFEKYGINAGERHDF